MFNFESSKEGVKIASQLLLDKTHENKYLLDLLEKEREWVCVGVWGLRGGGTREDEGMVFFYSFISLSFAK